MFSAIIVVSAIAFIVYRGTVEQARQDEYYQQEAEAQRQRAAEHDARMGR